MPPFGQRHSGTAAVFKHGKRKSISRCLPHSESIPLISAEPCRNSSGRSLIYGLRLLTSTANRKHRRRDRPCQGKRLTRGSVGQGDVLGAAQSGLIDGNYDDYGAVILVGQYHHRGVRCLNKHALGNATQATDGHQLRIDPDLTGGANRYQGGCRWPRFSWLCGLIMPETVISSPGSATASVPPAARALSEQL